MTLEILGYGNFRLWLIARSKVHIFAKMTNAKVWNASRFCVSSLRRGHANLLCIVPILVYVGPKPLRKRRKFDAFLKRISRFTFWKTIYGAWRDSLTLDLLHFLALGEKSISLFLFNINLTFCFSFSTDHNFSFKTLIRIILRYRRKVALVSLQNV